MSIECQNVFLWQMIKYYVKQKNIFSGFNYVLTVYISLYVGRFLYAAQSLFVLLTETNFNDKKKLFHICQIYSFEDYV